MRYILGIDTSGSDTLAGVVIDGKTIASDINTTRLKKRPKARPVQFQEFNHDQLAYIHSVVEQAVLDAGISYDQLDAIAVTAGPGLSSALEVGINFAKGLALSTEKPLIGVNHNEGHIYALRLAQPFREIEFPALALIVSGTATEILLMTDYGAYQRLGGTVDDTAGETIEKIGKILGFAYPAGPLIEQSANLGNGAAYAFSRSTRGESVDLSFNAIKLAVLNEITVASTAPNAGRSAGANPKRQLKADVSVNDVAASFQTAMFELLSKRISQMAQKNNVREILIVGGVAANQQLRQIVTKQTSLPVRFPPLHLCVNNGAMIAAAGFDYLEARQTADISLSAQPLWPLETQPA